MAALANLLQKVVELGGLKLAAARGGGVDGQLQDLIGGAAGHGRDVDPGNPRGKRKALLDGLNDLVALLLGLDQVPLVDKDHHGAAAVHGHVGDLLVLLGHAHGGVDHQKADVRAVDCLQAADQRVVLDVLVDLAFLAHTGSVYELDLLALPLDHGVDGVARGAGDVAHDGALLVGQAVCKRRLACVGAADDGKRKHALVLVDAVVFGQGLDDEVEKVAGAVAVGGRDGHRLAAAQGVEVPQVLVVAGGVVLLVHTQEDGLVDLAHDAGDLLVLVGDANGTVDQEDDDVGLLAGDEGLLADARRKDVLGFDGLDAAGVDELEGAAVPVGVVVRAVAGDAARLVDDGLAGLAKTVDERRLADVRTADNSYDGLRHGFSLLIGIQIAY